MRIRNKSGSTALTSPKRFQSSGSGMSEWEKRPSTFFSSGEPTWFACRFSTSAERLRSSPPDEAKLRWKDRLILARATNLRIGPIHSDLNVVEGDCMKTMTCKELGGTCDQPISARSWDDMVCLVTTHIAETIR